MPPTPAARDRSGPPRCQQRQPKTAGTCACAHTKRQKARAHNKHTHVYTHQLHGTPHPSSRARPRGAGTRTVVYMLDATLASAAVKSLAVGSIVTAAPKPTDATSACGGEPDRVRASQPARLFTATQRQHTHQETLTRRHIHSHTHSRTQRRARTAGQRVPDTRRAPQRARQTRAPPRPRAAQRAAASRLPRPPSAPRRRRGTRWE